MLWLTLSALAAPPSGSAAIIGGELSETGDIPEVVALYKTTGFACTGVLIAPDVVLTAGHCQADLSYVVIGSLDPSNDTEAETAVVREVFVYPDYLDTLDLAVVRLATPVNTPPARLALGCRLDHLGDGSIAVVAGYGANNRFGTDNDGMLRDVTIPIVDADCDNPTRGCNVDVLPGGELIAGGDQLDSCFGDSGGPLFLWVGDERFLTGIVSRGALPSNRPCGDGGIYTRIDADFDWILEQAGVPLDEPDCDGLPDPNLPPSLTVGTVETVVTGPVTFAIIATDPEEDALLLSVGTAPEHGTVTIAGLSATYTPMDEVNADDSFSLVLTDDGEPNLTDEAVVSVQVDTVLDEPVDPDTDTDETTGGGCACNSAPTSIWLLLPLLLLPLMRRRSNVGEPQR
ncbi:MAG: MYXO-CTERM domain-containing protein [Myxococcota bacterium]|jgi:MYXO-CTERM domain-containing protein